MQALPSRDTYAAIDLGSNSFHLIVATWDGGRIRVLDRHKEMVRLADGLDDRNQLSELVAARALACLQRFSQRIRHLDARNVRVVGTSTLRRARAHGDFVAQAEAALGRSIEVISGREEARLIYLGVSHALEDGAETRLVIDIGGGSTELITGRQFRPEHLESLHMGCVNFSQAWFPGGRVSERCMSRAELAAQQELEPVRQQFHRSRWDVAIGASGTLLALAAIARNLGLVRTGLSVGAIEQICDRLVKAGHVEKAGLPGLSAMRRPVIAGGAAITRALFHALEIDHLQMSQGALREGLLFDLLGRTRDEDLRDTTVAEVANRYHVDRDHAAQVASTALYLFDAVARTWALDRDENRKLLAWAARLHEVGMDVAHSSYHKHGGYLLEHMDMPGFSASQQALLAFLVRVHRRKLALDLLPVSGQADRVRLLRLALCLRLAVVLHRNRLPEAPPPLRLRVADDRLHVGFPEGWLAFHPLTLADLEQEGAYQRSAGFALTYG